MLGTAGRFRRVIVFAILAGSVSACSTTRIIPPASVAEPAPVFVLEHGGSSSLVLSEADGTLHRYAYGDWAYYAERQIGSSTGLAALFWATPAGLGHRQLEGPATADSVYRQVRVVIDKLHTLEVERDRVDSLHNRLEALFTATAHTHPSPDVDLVFVPYPEAYTLVHNSNHVVADWLEQLGCQVSNRPIISGWTVSSDR